MARIDRIESEVQREMEEKLKMGCKKTPSTCHPKGELKKGHGGMAFPLSFSGVRTAPAAMLHEIVTQRSLGPLTSSPFVGSVQVAPCHAAHENEGDPESEGLYIRIKKRDYVLWEINAAQGSLPCLELYDKTTHHI